MEYMNTKQNQQDICKFFRFKFYFQSNLCSHLSRIFHNINHIPNIKCLPNHHNSDICIDNLENFPYPMRKSNNLMDLMSMSNIYDCKANKEVNQLHNNHLNRGNLLQFYRVSMLDNCFNLLHMSSNLHYNSNIFSKNPLNILACNHIMEQ